MEVTPEIRTSIICMIVAIIMVAITTVLADLFREKLEKKINKDILPTLIEAVCLSEVTVAFLLLLHVTSTFFGQLLVPFINGETSGVAPYIYLFLLMAAIVAEFLFILWIGRIIGEDVGEYTLYKKEHARS